MTLQHRFTHSSPVLAELSRDLRSPPHVPASVVESVENVDSLEYIDKGLGLLGHLQRAQDDQIRQAFEQQRGFITEKFKRVEYENGRRDSLLDQRYSSIDQKFALVDQKFAKIKEQLEEFKEEVGQRFEEVGQRFEEVGQRFDRIETRIDTFQSEVGQRFEEMDARMFNSLSYRAHHEVHPVALLEQGQGLQRPDQKYFPRTVKQFWKLQSSQNAFRRFYLLQFYHIEGYKQWKEDDDEEVDSDSGNSSTGDLTLEQAVRDYPLRCLEALAARLGLNYDKISEQMQRQSRQIDPAQPTKRGQTDISAEQEIRQPSKKVYVKAQSMASEQSKGSEAEQREQDSQGSTDIVPESVDLPHRPRQRNPNDKNPTKSRRVRPEERSQGSTETISSSEYKKKIGHFL
ncbi:uncharacterized protein Z518_06022 [Rhinocladiella mackenziei CBS 650.93]|uniref:Uncharacterized protein n=1 Tax=Rhinocladiella mackenziei CBS 650.93 TaxID=1442369 RepID=A0A0D2J7X7_9EURO|nr:uncharacterized protein Z518_06022 [Rhinocladiella mackenziei CBS 650.93]KIX05150.1 hypothetical protein Z518_06022 [Rhinocladiella mackenziei CBS 650.93]